MNVWKIVAGIAALSLGLVLKANPKKVKVFKASYLQARFDRTLEARRGDVLEVNSIGAAAFRIAP